MITANVTRFVDLIRIAARRNPRTVAIVSDAGHLTYGELQRNAQVLAQGLLSRGLVPGDRLGILSQNRTEYLETYIACQIAGLVAVPVNHRLTSQEVQYVLGNCGARGLLIEAGYMPMLPGLLTSLPDLHRPAVLGLGAEAIGGSYQSLLAGDVTLAQPIPVHPSSPSTIFYTSGTTGFPKGAMMSHLNILTRFSSWGWEYGLSGGDCVLIPGPVFHNSFSALALITLAVGGRVVLMREFETGRAAELIHKEAVTWSFLVPKMISLLLEASGTQGDLSSLRGILSSGSPLPQALLDELVERLPRARICDAYGWTETGWLTICRHADLMRGKRCVGQAAFGCEIAILDGDGNELPAGTVGEVHAANPVPFLGYYGNPSATEAARHGRWESGGDMGVLDEEGFLTLVDRKNDMIISGGENIYPAEIERVLAEHPDVLEVAAVGVADARWGESPRACVVLRRGARLTSEEVLGFCDGRLARYKHPRSVAFVDALPRNAMGKVLRRELRDRFAAAQAVNTSRSA